MARRRSKLWILITVALVPFIIAALIIINLVIISNGYKQFTEDLYQSFQYGVENECLRAEYQGEATKVTEENASHVFFSISSSHFVTYKEDYETTDKMLFDFGNGDMMWLYKQDSSTVVIHYIYADGVEKVYITTEVITMITFERLISVEWGNNLWE